MLDTLRILLQDLAVYMNIYPFTINLFFTINAMIFSSFFVMRTTGNPAIGFSFGLAVAVIGVYLGCFPIWLYVAISILFSPVQVMAVLDLVSNQIVAQ